MCARTSRCPPMCYAVETAIAARVPLTSAYSLPFKVTKGAPHRWTFVLVALYSAAAIDGKSSIAPACGVRAGGGGSCAWGGGVRKGSFNGGGSVESCAHFANELPHCPPALPTGGKVPLYRNANAVIYGNALLTHCVPSGECV